jgi:hypothetical protein
MMSLAWLLRNEKPSFQLTAAERDSRDALLRALASPDPLAPLLLDAQPLALHQGARLYAVESR